MRKAIHAFATLFLTAILTLSGQDAARQKPGIRVIENRLILDNPPFAQCHASTLVELADGSLLTATFGGAHEGAADVKIWISREKSGNWSYPEVVADGRVNDTLSYPCWNPVLFRSNSGMLYLFYRVGKNPREWKSFMKKSSDEGYSWSTAEPLPEGFLGPIRSKPVEMPGNRLLCPASVETDTRWSMHMEILDLANGSWTRIPEEEGTAFGVIQPTILSDGPGNYRILCRSKQNVVVTSTSKDYGLTWTKLDSIPLPNPNSAIDGLTLGNGSHLLVYNPMVAGKEWWEGRNKLRLAWSADGIHWEDLLTLEEEPSGEFSYPAIIQTHDGLVHITYTYKRVNIRHVVLKVS